MTGRCQCRCGRQAPVADHTEQRKGWVKGQPKRFIHGHHMRGRTRQPAIPPTPISERFWDKVDKTSSPRGCWLWTGCIDNHGYGRISANRRPVNAHRAAWSLSNGPIPDGLWVLHRCDNPPCVNPEHLFLGTALDNMQDAAAKGRVRTPGLCGEQHPNSKLTREQVRAIYRSAKSGEHPRELATDFGVSRDTIRFIATRKFWREATEDLV